MNSSKKVVGQDRFVLPISEYSNGIETTGGLYRPEELEDVTDMVIGITYDSDHATELPFNWPELYVLDDNGKRQRIKEVHFNRNIKYEMEDGTFSEEVTV